jgi:ABC-type spermidine/putrescine transport system, permease component II
MSIKKIIGKFWLPLIVAKVYLFLYIPMFILMVYSCNDNVSGFKWLGFTLKWYAALWHDAQIWHALGNSLIVAFSAVFLSISMSALFIFFGSRAYVRRMLFLFYLNLVIPEIVLAVGLMSLFYFLNVPLSLTTLIAAHTILGLGYVFPMIYNRYVELDTKYVEASLDLGATRWQTFRLVILPLLYPSMSAGALLIFIISFDDFILSFFCAGGATQTLPMYIFAPSSYPSKHPIVLG